MTTDTISVIAGGHSAGSLKEPPRGMGRTIGVNESMLLARCNFGVTMDRLWMESRYERLKGCVLDGVLKHVHARSAALKNIPHPRPAWLHPFECDHESTTPSEHFGRLNGTNSGLCALGLAYQMRPERIVLIGFDMNRSPDGRAYWHEPYPWTKPEGATTGGKYKAWAAQFALFAQACRRAKIEVINTSMTSAITEFKKAKLEHIR